MTATYTLESLQAAITDLYHAVDVDSTGSRDCISHLEIEFVGDSEWTHEGDAEYAADGTPNVIIRDMGGSREVHSATDAPAALAEWVRMMFEGSEVEAEAFAVADKIETLSIEG